MNEFLIDIDKLTWMNGMYLRNMDEDTYFETVKPYLEAGIKSDIDLREVAKIIQPRIDRLDQIVESVDFFDILADYDLEMYRHKKMKTTKEIALTSLKEVYKTLSEFDNWSNQEAVHDVLMSLPAKLEMKNGQVLWPVRTALTGKQFTPGGAIEIAHILGKEESLRRIEIGISRLEAALSQPAE